MGWFVGDGSHRNGPQRGSVELRHSGGGVGTPPGSISIVGGGSIEGGRVLVVVVVGATVVGAVLVVVGAVVVASAFRELACLLSPEPQLLTATARRTAATAAAHPRRLLRFAVPATPMPIPSGSVLPDLNRSGRIRTEAYVPTPTHICS